MVEHVPRKALVVSLCAAVLTGCASAPDPGVLTVMDYHTDEPMHSAMETQLARCGEEIGKRIEHRSVVNDQLVPKALRMASSRSLPDVLMLDNPDLPQFAATQALNPLPELGITGEGIYPNVLAASTYDGTLYGIPPTVNTLALYYNADLLEQAGVEPPRTWEELRATAAALTDEQQYGIAFSALAGLEGAYQFLSFLWPNGADERRLDSPEAVEALQLWVDLVETGSASRAVVNWGQSEVRDQFTAGRVAMMVNGSWQAPTLRETPGLRWGVVPIPVPHPGAPPATALGGEVLTIPKTTPQRQRAAADLVRCLSSPEAQAAVALAADRVPASPVVAERLREQVPDLRIFYDTVPDARSRTAKLGTRWPQTAQAMWTAVQSALTGTATARQALERAQRQLDADS
ncbi:ABC transporter substrate-binding protein [Saccharopolyspora sp. CA-218241]|uniref:ABC transporter substrate-binding protein n=1 Tax=Saccharopolyspora sp. CA-218241 TaxID=3240027 RepID=UPI003D97B56F